MDNRKAWGKHMEASHLTEYMKVTEGAVEDLIIYEMSNIG